MLLLDKCLVVLLISLAMVYCAKKYRFDYEWSDRAEGWFKYHAVPSTWDEARLRCHAEGAILASPLTNQLKAAIVAFVQKQVSSSRQLTLFSGVHSVLSKGVYNSIEGVPLLRLALTWAPGEPDNQDNAESCLSMDIGAYVSGFMSDTRCGAVLPYVCYKKDADLTMTECGTTDPGYILYPKTGSCYKFHKRGVPWSEAYMTCAAEGGHLVIINNEEEAAVVRDILASYPQDIVFSFNHDMIAVGFHDWGHFGYNFMTIHGELLDVNYSRWADGQPNNASYDRTHDTGEYCGSMMRDARYHDNFCNVPTTFLCEKSPDSLL